MIPSIFVSSTIVDLRYLRDGVRDAVEELAYRPVMSEHGEIGYINPMTAAESCYRSVKQCQLVILIVGCRYGSLDSDGLSVTHREFRAAREEGLPTITFVEPSVMSFKEVFDADSSATIWDTFSRMDHPKKTFQLLEEIASSEAYNAIIPYESVGDAKKKLKMQIADYVGNKLAQTDVQVNRQLSDVLAEVRTIRNFVVHPQADAQRTKSYLAVTRFLLNDQSASYRGFLEAIFDDLDTAIEKIGACEDLQKVVAAAGYEAEVVEEIDFSGFPPRVDPGQPVVIRLVHMLNRGGFVVRNDKVVQIARSTFDEFNAIQRSLHAKAKLS